MKIIKDRELYRKCIPPEAPLYVQPGWMDLFSEDWNARIGLDDRGNPVWLWPYQKKTRYGFKKLGRLPFCPDNGPVCSVPEWEGLFDPGTRRWFSMTVIDDRRNQLSPDIMMNTGWEITDRYYQYFDVPAYPQDFKAVSRSKRKRMKKNSHYEFVRLEGLEEAGPLFLSSFYSLGHDNMAMMELETWKGMLNQTFDHYLFGLKDPQGDLLSAQWLVGHRDILHGWLAVRHPLFPDSGARELLLWHILQWARDHYRIYDLGGSSIRGVRQFNLEMGADEVCYNRYTRYRPWWVRRL